MELIVIRLFIIRKQFVLSLSLVISLILTCIPFSGWAKVVSSSSQEILNQEISQYKDPQELADAVQKIFNENDPNRRLQLISHWLQTDSKEILTKVKQPYLWATLNALKADALRNLKDNQRSNNLEQAIFHFNQAIEVYSISNNFKREESLIRSSLPFLHSERFSIGQEETGNIDILMQQFYQDQGDIWNKYITSVKNHFSSTGEKIASLISGYGSGQNPKLTGIIELDIKIIAEQELKKNITDREPEPDLSYFNFAISIKPELAIFSYLINPKFSLLDLALQENERHFQESRLTPQGRLSIIKRARDLFDTAIGAELKKKNYVQALYLLERSKARLLRESLSTDDVYLSHLPFDKKEKIQNLHSKISNLETKLLDNQKSISTEENRVLRIELMQKKQEMHKISNNLGLKLSNQEINQLVANLPLNSAIVAPIFTDTNTIVFILPAGTRNINESHLLVISDFSRRTLRSMMRGGKEDQWASEIFSYWDWANEKNLTIRHEKKIAWQNQLNSKNEQWGGYIKAYRDRTNETDDVKRKEKHTIWQNQLDISLNEMRIKLLEPILAKFEKLGIHSDARLFWLPDDDSSMLPLHSVMINKSPLLASYSVQFVPSLAGLATAQKRLQNDKADGGVLALVNPTNDLDFALIEGDLISRSFAHSSILRGDAGSLDKFNQTLIETKPTPSYLHFATHGSYQWQNPLDSGLELSKGQKLNLKYLLSNANLLNGKRLAVLSACETGLTDLNVPSEALGLPNAFLQSGVPGVISTLWTVNDGSTALLMDKFYKLNREHNFDPPKALAKAQEWLRTAKNSELRKLLDAYLNESSLLPIQKQMLTLLTKLREGKLDEKTFQDPYYWAGFVYSGM